MSEVNERTQSKLARIEKYETEYKRIKWLVSQVLAIVVDDTQFSIGLSIEEAVNDEERILCADDFFPELRELIVEDVKKENSKAETQHWQLMAFVDRSIGLLRGVNVSIKEIQLEIMELEVDCPPLPFKIGR